MQVGPAAEGLRAAPPTIVGRPGPSREERRRARLVTPPPAVPTAQPGQYDPNAASVASLAALAALAPAPANFKLGSGSGPPGGDAAPAVASSAGVSAAGPLGAASPLNAAASGAAGADASAQPAAAIGWNGRVLGLDGHSLGATAAALGASGAESGTNPQPAPSTSAEGPATGWNGPVLAQDGHSLAATVAAPGADAGSGSGAAGEASGGSAGGAAAGQARAATVRMFGAQELSVLGNYTQAQLALWDYDDFRGSPLAAAPAAAPRSASDAPLIISSASAHPCPKLCSRHSCKCRI